MSLELRIVEGPFEGRRLIVRAGQTFKIGRTEWADFAIPHDDKMSGVHFAIESSDGRFRVVDLQSTNGTLLNGKPMESQELKTGDVVCSGNTKFLIQVSGGPVTSSATKPSAPVAQPAAPKSISLNFIKSDLPYATALADENPLVRREALLTAAWTRQPWLLEYGRRLCAAPIPTDRESLRLFAVLAPVSDAPLFASLGRTLTDRPFHFELLALFAHPSGVPDMLRAMENHDANIAFAAGRAFERMTGAEIASERTAIIAPAEGDAPREVALPSATLAMRHWSKVRSQMERGVRWRRGIEVHGAVAPDDLEKLDMASRWEISLRAAFHGTPHGEKLPPGRRYPWSEISIR